ncbi:MAG: SDR family oxidoreductase [Polyangiaceae bacterium]|nr:SDR family oxidoreductase [Polyangiaceae bacterium]
MSTEPKWAVILGASEGTGAAIARAVARDPGLHVFGVHRGRFPDKAAEVERDVAAFGKTTAMLVADAGNAEGAKIGADEVAKRAGPKSVHLFVHSIANASLGRFTSGGEDQLVPKQFQKTFESMAHSFVYWTQELLARDLFAPGARLLGLTNPLHESLLRNCGLVVAAKAALEMYVRHLAFELGPRGMRCNLLKFPTVITPAVRKVYSPEVLERLEAAHARMIPAGRICGHTSVTSAIATYIGLYCH